MSLFSLFASGETLFSEHSLRRQASMAAIDLGAHPEYLYKIDRERLQVTIGRITRTKVIQRKGNVVLMKAVKY